MAAATATGARAATEAPTISVAPGRHGRERRARSSGRGSLGSDCNVRLAIPAYRFEPELGCYRQQAHGLSPSGPSVQFALLGGRTGRARRGRAVSRIRSTRLTFSLPGDRGFPLPGLSDSHASRCALRDGPSGPADIPLSGTGNRRSRSSLSSIPSHCFYWLIWQLRATRSRGAARTAVRPPRSTSTQPQAGARALNSCRYFYSMPAPYALESRICRRQPWDRGERRTSAQII